MSDRVTVTSTSDNKAAVDAALEHGTPAVEKTEAASEPTPGEETATTGDEEAPVEDEGEGDTEASAGESDAETSGEKPRRPKKSEVQERIDYLTWRGNQERARREEAEAEIIRLRQGPQQQQQPEPEFETPKPKLEDYETLEAWQDDLTSWTADKVTWETTRMIDARMGQVITPEKLADQRVSQEHAGRLQAHITAYPEFKDLIQKTIADAVPATPLMAEHFRHSEVGPALMHYLAENPDECRTIAGLSVPMQLARLGRIEERIESGRWKPGSGSGNGSVAAPPSSRRYGSPPEPPNPVGGRGAKGPVSPDNMSYREFKAWREKNGARRR